MTTIAPVFSKRENFHTKRQVLFLLFFYIKKAKCNLDWAMAISFFPILLKTILIQIAMSDTAKPQYSLSCNSFSATLSKGICQGQKFNIQACLNSAKTDGLSWKSNLGQKFNSLSGYSASNCTSRFDDICKSIVRVAEVNICR